MSSRSILAGHFENLDQQYEAGQLAMWIFLITEVLFFGVLFCAYVVYRTLYPEAWALGSQLNSASLGAAMTATLLLSSFTMAMAVRWAQLGRPRPLIAFLILTILLGLTFLGIKGYEYHHHWADNLVPGVDFSGYHGDQGQQVELFLCFYFIMTLIHAAHMLVGIGVLSVLSLMAWQRQFTAQYYSPVEITGLYWHFVDIIWLFLFPLLYLVDLHK